MLTEIGGWAFSDCNLSLVIYAHTGSAAERYARKNDIGFQAI